MSYYPPLKDYPYDSRLNVEWQRPPLDRNDGYMITSDAGPRTRLVIEGESDFVQRLFEATDATLTEIRAEIEAEA